MCFKFDDSGELQITMVIYDPGHIEHDSFTFGLKYKIVAVPWIYKILLNFWDIFGEIIIGQCSQVQNPPLTPSFGNTSYYRREMYSNFLLIMWSWVTQIFSRRYFTSLNPFKLLRLHRWFWHLKWGKWRLVYAWFFTRPFIYYYWNTDIRSQSHKVLDVPVCIVYFISIAN